MPADSKACQQLVSVSAASKARSTPLSTGCLGGGPCALCLMPYVLCLRNAFCLIPQLYDINARVRRLLGVCVRILLHMSPHTTTYVPAHMTTCVLILLHVSSY
jgi:hypothetical protein